MGENFQSKLQDGIKQAMKSQDKLRLETLRGLLSAIKYEAIQKVVKELPETACLEVFQREIKKRREAIDFAQKAGRQELVAQNNQEIAIIEGFLPQQLSGAELEKIILKLKSEIAGANMGLVMKALKEKYSGQYDGKVASDLAKRLLA